MATKIELYNQALSHLSTERLDPTNGLSEERKERYELDSVYEKSRLLLLEEGLWKFAIRSSQLTYDPDLEQNYGLQYAFAIPDDFVRLAAFCDDPYFKHEVEDYVEENGIWYTSVDTIYIRYVSKGEDYGLNLGLYPENYCVALTAEMALRSALPISKDRGTRNDLIRIKTEALAKSRRLDALDERIKRAPPGRWVSSRGRVTGPHFSNGRMRW